MEIPYKDMINTAYIAYNARDMDTMLGLMHENIRWPNGWKGGTLHGKTALRDYWIEQWKHILPTVQPLAFKKKRDGRIEVIVHQVVTDLKNNPISDQVIKHIYTIREGLVAGLEIGPE